VAIWEEPTPCENEEYSLSLVHDPDSLDFGEVYYGEYVYINIWLKNDGCRPITVTSATAPKFSVQSPSLPTGIANGRDTWIYGRYLAVTPGFVSFNIVVSYKASDRSTTHSFNIHVSGNVNSDPPPPE
jgi:hypothetical protein